ncbi:MAG: transposase family protein [Phycisphaerae bacterium]|nr:transposase family protein [Phycisphaerae bacterium]
MADSILSQFADLPDTRSARGQQRDRSDILTIAIRDVICGAESWTERWNSPAVTRSRGLVRS